MYADLDCSQQLADQFQAGVFALHEHSLECTQARKKPSVGRQ